MRTRKPTGDAECPPEVHHTHEIEHKIQSKVVCRDLEDEEIIDFEDGKYADDEMSNVFDHPENDDKGGPAPSSKPAPRVRTTHIKSPLLS